MRNLLILLISVFFLCSCGQISEQEIDPILDHGMEKIADEVAEKMTSKEKSIPQIIPQREKSVHLTYEGEIEGEIPLQLIFSQIGNLIQGELIYKKIGKPIPIIGTVNEGYYRILEFSDNGEITGILSGDFENDSKNLTWFSPFKRSRLKMELELKESRESDVNLKGGDVKGKYHYQFGENGSAGTITVERVGEDSISYKANCHTHPPAYNMAYASGTLFLDGNKASVDYKKGKYEDCAYDIYFYKNFVHIKYVDDRNECGFGHNAHVDGIYKRMK